MAAASVGSPSGRTTPNTPHMARPSQPRARAQPVVPGVSKAASGTSRASAIVLPRSSEAPVATGADELDAEPVAAHAPERLDRADRAGERAASGPGRTEAVAVTTSRDGLSPNSSTAGDIAVGTRTGRAEPTPHRRTRRVATARPPPDTSWALATRPRAIASPHERLQRRLAGEVERGQAVLGGGPGEGGVGRPDEPGDASPTSRIVSPSATNAGPTRPSRRRLAARRRRSRASGRSTPAGDSL